MRLAKEDEIMTLNEEITAAIGTEPDCPVCQNHGVLQQDSRGSKGGLVPSNFVPDICGCSIDRIKWLKRKAKYLEKRLVKSERERTAMSDGLINLERTLINRTSDYRKKARRWKAIAEKLKGAPFSQEDIELLGG